MCFNIFFFLEIAEILGKSNFFYFFIFKKSNLFYFILRRSIKIYNISSHNDIQSDLTWLNAESD